MSKEQVNVGHIPGRKVIAFLHVSLDGFVAGPNGEMNWIRMDDEIFANAQDLASEVDTALYGRTTFNMMKDYWPGVLLDETSTPRERQHAAWIENVEKVVFSRTIDPPEWNNTRLIRQNIPEEMARLKKADGGRMMIFGSPRLTHSFMQWNLIDEYRLNINPFILGRGIPLFGGDGGQVRLELLSSKTFSSGVVGLHYRQVK
jgi:dihydrofolate reductase